MHCRSFLITALKNYLFASHKTVTGYIKNHQIIRPTNDTYFRLTTKFELHTFRSKSNNFETQRTLRLSELTFYRRSQYYRSTSLHKYVVKLLSKTF